MSIPSITYFDWCCKILPLLKNYIGKADGLWGSPHRLGDLPTSRALWDHDETVERQNLTQLFDIFEAANNIDAPQHTHDALEQDMNVKLGLWLCSYFQSIPRPDLWADVASLAFHSGSYPAGAFYLKLAGDAFRHERREWDKRKFAEKESFKPEVEDWKKEGILVMAYSPLLLVPDRNKRRPDTESEQYYQEVEKLALLYARIQQRLYIRSGYPIRYAVSRGSACETLHCALDGKDAVEESSAILRRYFPELANSLQISQEVVVFPYGATKRRGLTSCVLATEDGVNSNQPNRSGNAQRAACYWIEGRLLSTERDKLVQLWDEYDDNRDRSKEEAEAALAQPNRSAEEGLDEEDTFIDLRLYKSQFSQAWYNENIVTKIEESQAAKEQRRRQRAEQARLEKDKTLPIPAVPTADALSEVNEGIQAARS